jgi:hypothetical protein
MAYTYETISEPEVSVYKGSPILSIPMVDGRKFSFGRKKAIAILEWMGDIEKFVEESETRD